MTRTFSSGIPKSLRHVMAAIRGALGRGIQSQLVAFPAGDANAGFHLRVVHVGGGVAILEHVVGCAEALLDVSTPVDFRFGLVLRIERDIAVRPDLDAFRAKSFFLIEHEGKRFVFNGDEPQGLFRDMPIGRGDGCYRFPEKAHRVVEGIASLSGDFLDLVNVLPPAGDRARTPNDSAILMRQNELDARKRQGFGDINLANLSVSMRAAQYARIKHPGEMDVAAIGSFPCDAFHGVNARGGMADRLQ